METTELRRPSTGREDISRRAGRVSMGLESRSLRPMTLDPAAIDQILIRRRVELRFRLDPAGRLLGENLPEDPADHTAPRLYACLGGDGLVYAFRHDVPDDRVEHATAVLEALADALFEDPDRLADAAAAIAADWGDAPVMKAGPVYRIPRGLPQPAGVSFIDASNRDALARFFPHTHAHLDALTPCAAQVIDGDAVAICRAVRRSRIALEAGVDTIEAFRGRGFGAAVVTAWAERAWQDGRVPCYAADASSSASLALAHRLGMMRIGTEFTIE